MENNSVEREPKIIFEPSKDMESLDRIKIVALFAAFSIFLSSIEYLLPRPIPFFRYGLANIAVLLCVRHFNFRDLFFLSLLKVLGLAILNGTFISYVFVFSFLGTMTSLCTMWIIAKLAGRHISLVGISILGALTSNVVQVACAILYIFGTQAWIIAPYLMMLGSISGLCVGMIAQFYWNKSKILEEIFLRYSWICIRHDGERADE